MEIHQRISEVRSELELTQNSFAKKLNVPAVFIFRIETGEVKTIGHTFLQNLTETFKVNANWLLNGTGNKFL